MVLIVNVALRAFLEILLTYIFQEFELTTPTTTTTTTANATTTATMFPQGKYAKSISRNTHYVIAFKNPRDQSGMKNLLLQAFPTYWQDVMEVHQK